MNFMTTTMSCIAAYSSTLIASSPGHSQFFNVAHGKTGEPGRRNYVRVIAQSVYTVKDKTNRNYTAWAAQVE